MQVKKRNGSLEPFNLDKIHKVVGWAVDGISGVTISDIEVQAEMNLRNGISTREIHEILIKAAYDLISEESPNYTFVASRLLNYQLRKDVWGEAEPPRLLEHIKQCVLDGVYDEEFLSWYTESEIHKMNKFVKHERDYLFTHAGLQQMVDKYLVKEKSTGIIYETPQFAYLMIVATLLKNEKPEERLSLIKEAYNAISLHKISFATPILAGVRTPRRYYASCILVSVGDDIQSIMNSNSAIGLMTAGRAGIGIEVGSIRPINAPIRGGEVLSTGLIPFLKMFESTVKSTSQNGIRGGCIDQDTTIEIIESVEIDGKTYGLNDKIEYEGKMVTISELIPKTV